MAEKRLHRVAEALASMCAHYQMGLITATDFVTNLEYFVTQTKLGLGDVALEQARKRKEKA